MCPLFSFGAIMGYQFQNTCFDNLYDFHVAFAQYCSVSGTALGTKVLSCSANESGYIVMQTFNADTGSAGTPWNYTPQAIECNPTLLNQTAFMWELTLILVAGFAIRAIIKALQ